MQNKKEQLMGDLSEALWLRLTKSGLPVHSLLTDWNGITIKEAYQAPYGKTDLHRMFSITKSFCSIAAGFLCADGKITLEDRIVDYFPEYCSDQTHPWLKEMTIRHMLSMETCHTSTTYKIHSGNNWVESFFITPPSHRSGQIFLYDTSSSHTLAALVKKLTGKGVLDYLREKCLDQIGFSKEAYIINDPFGSEMGGSGLMALPSDLLKLGRYCMDTILDGQGDFADYLREAVSFQTPTVHFGQTFDEQQGYGYQFWRIRNGFAMYGMGGQYVLFYPKQNLVFVVTADTQNIKGGNQLILDMIGDVVESFTLETEALKNNLDLRADFNQPDSWNESYRLCDNQRGFQKLSLSFDQSEGVLTLTGSENCFSIPFSFEEPKVSFLQGYGERIAVKAMWADSNSLYLPIQVVGECVGSIHIMLRLSDEKITVWMKKIEETYFAEFQGFFEGKKE
jgi:CubicO group peptidase (beta-lactamase class C family)